MLLRITMGVSLLETLLLVGVLLAWADRVAGGRVLAAFLAAFGLWVVGNELPNWWGPSSETLALHLLATAPLTSAVFFHFCVVFCRAPLDRRWIGAGYALGAVAVVASQVLLPARFLDHPDIGRLAVAQPAAIIPSASWVILGTAGVAVLIHALMRRRREEGGPARAQVAAVTASCLWGLICIGGYAIALLDWPIYPFPLLALPLYPLMLVYGILRYGVFVANAWAGRALVWTLLLAVGVAIVGLMPLLLPFESRWLNGLAVAAGCLALNGPVRRFVQRLIYPGGEVSAQDIAAWRVELARSDSFDTLSATASQLLTARVGVPTRVWIDDTDIDTDTDTDASSRTRATPSPGPSTRLSSAAESENAASAARVPSPSWQTFESAPPPHPAQEQQPELRLHRHHGLWTSTWTGWEAAPPGPRQAAELFASALIDAARDVAQAQAAAIRERERQVQARLAELGALAATVAHDIRNPLNIIGMAVAMAPADTRQEVGTQVARIAHLASDLLDYAKPWKLQPGRFDLTALARTLARREPGVRLSPAWPDTLWVERLDPRRLEQALVNLIENARGASAEGCVIDIDIDASHVHLHVCDNGSGVPQDLRDRLFEPFASRSSGGTGLGLAIVARVAQAHQGRVALTDRAPWRTCFSLELPR
ncbi:sensor histidine kinase [Roseateles terrae]|uniref:histidine kinase n=1 Tax=Roseateles terrae TaxID=431060 RepID=A0ABR6GL74_9BURK|nr:HAMP domain-containing sensor histidine kinase [Roseateles terrae]MBB3192857.1 signal transduction histidine kinase [Roseateles terrae]OWQ89882.1 two-component sensor histidine kinase [Roseateles terrae]